MNFDDALRQYLPQIWFRFKFAKYKYLGRGEPELWLLRHLVEPGTTALDVGASIGMFANEMARHAGKVIAFEANPAVAAFTRGVVPRNVAVMNVALSSSAGRTMLKIPLSPRGHTITELATIAPDNPLGGETVSVEVMTQRLDELALTNCSFIKIDVEGHEEAVLDGATQSIASQRPILMIEADDAFNPGIVARLVARFAALSYGCFILTHGRLRPVAEFNAARDQDHALLKYPRHRLPSGAEYINNFIFIPQEKVARILARVR